MDLDLSYAPSLELNFWAGAGEGPFAPLGQTLRRLNLTACDLTSLRCGDGDGDSGDDDVDGHDGGDGGGDGSGDGGGGARLVLGGLRALAELCLAENDELVGLANLVAGLAPVRATLEELDCRECPVSGGGGSGGAAAYRKALASGPGAFPELKLLDGKSLRMTSAVGGVLSGDGSNGGRVADDGKGAGMLGDGPSMAALEREVGMAMRGERDSTVIA